MKILIPTLLIVLLFFVISTSYSQNVTNEALQECAVIESPAERVICYDLLAQSMQQPEYCSTTSEAWRVECGGDGNYQENSEIEYTGNWFFHTTVDDFDDSVTHYLLNAPIKKNTTYDSDLVAIQLICSEELNQLVFMVNWDSVLDKKDGRVQTTYRMDSQTANTANWAAVGNKMIAYGGSSERNLKFVNRLIASSGNFLIMSDGYLETLTAEFDVSGLSEVLHQVTQPCGL